MQNNTGYNWTIRGGRPDDDVDGRVDRVLVARSPCGRVEIEVHRDEGYFWNPVKGEGDEGSHYIVSVYESTHYDYYPKHDHGEWTHHELAAHLRPSKTGQGWAPTYDIARNLVVNGIVAVEEQGKWISGTLDDNHREYVYTGMDEEEAIKELRGMFRATATDTEQVTHDDALELAREHEQWKLAEYIYGLTEDDFWWTLADVEEGDTETPV